MALETLKGIKEIDGFKVSQRETAEDRWDADKFIDVFHPLNRIHFQIQNGPIKEVGVNGAQVDTIIETAKFILEGLNKNFSCEENRKAAAHLEVALYYLKERKRNREKRGVEGYNKA